MHNLLVTHAKYVENETTCLGTRTRQAMVMATLSGQSYSDDTEQNCHQIYERQGEKERERERKCGRARGSETHTNTLLIVGTANGSLELALTVKQVDTVKKEGEEEKWPTIQDLYTLYAFRFNSAPHCCSASPPPSSTLPFSLLCFQVAFVAAKFA